MATLTITQSHNFVGESLTNIDSIVFNHDQLPGPDSTLSATFSLAQFGPGEISDRVSFTGSDVADTVTILMPFSSSLDALFWTFHDWNTGVFAVLDRILIVGSPEADSVLGSSENDEIDGNSGNDVLLGSYGEDTVLGGTGDDTVAARQTFDSGFINENGVTTLTGADVDIGGLVDGEQGNDLLVIGHDFVGTMTVDGGIDRGADIDTLQFSGDHVFNTNTAALNTLDLENHNGTSPFGFAIVVNRIENVLGSDRYKDVFRGDNNANMLNGFGNNDRLEGRGGADDLLGGSGTDVADYSSSLAVNVDLQRATQVGNDAQGDTLSSIEQVDGSLFSDILRGNSGANLLFGNGGSDTLEGRAGADTLNGASGFDTASYASSNAAVTISIREPNQTALMSGGHAAGDVFFSIEGLAGSSFSDNLTGNSLDNVLDGGSNGQDRLFGLGGSDTLRGGIATDELTGGDGNDRLDGGFEGDFLDGSAGTDSADYLFATRNTIIRLGLNGADGKADADPSALLGNSFEDILRSIENVIGSHFRDEISGNELANAITANNGDDYITGDLGADSINGGNGIDVVDYNISPQAITIALNGTAGTGGFAAGDRLTLIETVGASQFNDTVTGNSAGNTLIGFAGFDDLFGGGGNDTLDGGADPDDLIGGSGVDTMRGGAGSDTYDVDNPGDIVDESVAGSTGTDTVRASITYSLLSANVRGNVERLTLIGTAAIDGTGNALNNLITGNAAANVLDGRDGADTLNGAGGDDTYVLGSGTDTVNDTSGTDTITSTINRDIKGLAAIENLILLGSAVTGSGNDLDNRLTGNAAGNVFAGRDGIDTILGNGGADFLFGQGQRDRLTGGTENDTFVYQAATDSGPGDLCDVINDFDDEGDDRIDFGGVFGGTLRFIGTDAFTGALDEVRINDIAGPELVIEVNLAGGLAPEMQIFLFGTNANSMGEDDFVL